MTCELDALCLDAHDPSALAEFWATVLGWDVRDDGATGATAVPTDDTGFALRFRPSTAPKVVQNLMHLDLTSASWEDQVRAVELVLELGGRHIDVGQAPHDEHVVLADPEGNELCIIEPGNGFLADCGLVGAVAGDGTHEVGVFWAAALGWPLVWDEGEETAIRSPNGGPKLTWGGTPLMPRRVATGCASSWCPARPTTSTPSSTALSRSGPPFART